MPQKTRIRIWPGNIPKGHLVKVLQECCVSMLIDIIFTIAKKQNQSRQPTDEWIRNMIDIDNQKFYL